MTFAKKDDPRNADEFVKRKEDLLVLAAKTGFDATKALETVGDDNIAQIGVLATLLEIDARIALNTSVSLVDLWGSPPSNPVDGSPEPENLSKA
jgi:hypothetical protein